MGLDVGSDRVIASGALDVPGAVSADQFDDPACYALRRADAIRDVSVEIVDEAVGVWLLRRGDQGRSDGSVEIGVRSVPVVRDGEDGVEDLRLVEIMN